jgi:serine/threonine protein kinase
VAKELGRFIAAGRTADVYEWGANSVLKLFRESVDLATIKHEHRSSVAVYKAGAPAPEPGELVSMGARYGIEYERIEGVPLSHAIGSDPSKLIYYADLMADTHLRVNSIENVEGLSARHAILAIRLRDETVLDAEAKRCVLNRLHELGTGTNLCHGDFHPENILLRDNKVTVLDWTVASSGDALSDLAQTVLILSGYVEAVRSRSTEAVLHQFIQRYLLRRQESSHILAGNYRDWIPVLAAARLSDGIEEQKEWLVDQARSLLSQNHTSKSLIPDAQSPSHSSTADES